VCNGNLVYEKFYGPLHILSFSYSTDKNQKCPNEFINCMLSEIPNIVEINKISIMLRGIVGYNPPLNGISSLGHYICYAKRSHLYWEVSAKILFQYKIQVK